MVDKPAAFESRQRRRSVRGMPTRLLRLCLKELRETLRDRRTIVTLLLMPPLLYSLLGLAFQKFIMTAFEPLDRVELQIGVESEEARTSLQSFLSEGNRIFELQLDEELAAAQGDRGADLAGAEPGDGAKKLPDPAAQKSSGLSDQLLQNPTIPEVRRVSIVVIRPGYLDEAVREGVIDLGLRLTNVSRSDRPNRPRPLAGVYVYRSASPISEAAVRYCEERLDLLNQDFVERRLPAMLRLNWPLELPVAMEHELVNAKPVSFASTLIPLILILMTVTGAVYPAIDLTAGERERGTLETLMAAPVPRLGLLAGKYVAVVTVSLLTAVVNLAAMALTIVVTGVEQMVFGPGGMSLSVLAKTLGLMVLFASFFAAILLALTSFARSFKEAQSYLIPVILLALFPGVLALTPGLVFNQLLAIVPVINVVLLARDLFQDAVNPVLATATILSTLFYAMAALGLAGRIFGTDAVLYGSQATWLELLRPTRRRPEVPSLSAALFCVALVFPVYFVGANLLGRWGARSGVYYQLLMAGATTLLVFGFLPWVVARLQRLNLSETFRLRRPPWIAFPAGLLLGLALWPLAYEICLLNQWLGLLSFGPDLIETVNRQLRSWREVNVTLLIATLAVCPAICEEWLFRGYLFSSLSRVTSPARAVLFSATLFGAFHVVTSVLALERFLPSTFLGIVLGWVCWRTRSILPGILIHTCHNGSVLLIAYYQSELEDLGLGHDERAHLPLTWLVVSLASVLVGIGVLGLATRYLATSSNRQEPAEAP